MKINCDGEFYWMIKWCIQFCINWIVWYTWEISFRPFWLIKSIRTCHTHSSCYYYIQYVIYVGGLLCIRFVYRFQRLGCQCNCPRITYVSVMHIITIVEYISSYPPTNIRSCLYSWLYLWKLQCCIWVFNWIVLNK